MLTTSTFQSIYCPAGLADIEDVNRELTHGRWRNNTCVQSMMPLKSLARGHHLSIVAKKFWDIYADYFMDKGAVY